MSKKHLTVKPDDAVESDGADFFKTYFEYNRTLRAWFVAFGIGGPALFLVNEHVSARLVAAGRLYLVAALFVIGAAAQVIGALMNKISNWYVYYSCLDDEFTSTRKYRLAEWLIDQFWIDILLDVVTILAFGAAIWFMMTVFG
ncbi:MAG: hypothetical protein A2X56_08245 [Nitrospirae bacterium GWC2_57_13]|jgi:hypothetical protein|nr:MAG: hypothetical protein A2072_08370 [Nitrospirae bacterium GWC1_57_7]OGW27680.1 MAG: hypothetical protein A2X56_08245 [Nitrospirae bacterium GWC2_57_13]OGW45233.1 MAG: hypothetical protein A2X57_00840 [Nitrospirae bacterium GWD2_57_8]HAR46007.1 hypothetical protein [Nitrospiraceae bacterium]HAS52990.1 hypothetical protein [Nitrospiraceae bacterium]